MMHKRYGAVASQSPALARLTDRLRSWGGLSDVCRCMSGGVVFHDTKAGIPECSLLVAEFDKCQAGGLPPPARVPTEAEQKAEKAEQARRAAVAAAQALEAEDAAQAAKEEEVHAAEADMVLLTAQDNAGSSSGLAPVEKTREQKAQEDVQTKMQQVHFRNTPEGSQICPSGPNIWRW